MKLPDTWREVFLPQIAELIGGGTPDRSNTSNFGGAIPWITPSDVTKLDSLWIHSTRESITEEGLKNSPAKAVPIGSVLMATRVAVGRAAIAGVELATNQDITSLVVNQDIVDSEYLARAIESLSVLLQRRSQGSTIKGIPRSTVGRLKIPLPTLLEQLRIVEVLKQAETLRKHRAAVENNLEELTREQYHSFFGNVLGNERAWEMRRIGQISEVVRGSSPRPQGDPRLFGGQVPRLMVSDLTRDGLWVNAVTDSLTEQGAKSSRPMLAHSVVVAVSGAPGLAAILNHDACIHDGFVGLRNLHENLVPEFVAYTLNLLRAKNDQQAVGAVFRNLTTNQVKAVSIPVPPIKSQHKFRDFLMEMRAIQQGVAKSNDMVSELINALTVDAFSGELTKTWREQRTTEIADSARKRDVHLRERGAKLGSPLAASVPPPARSTDLPRSSRNWLVSELSIFQNLVLEAFLTYADQPLLAEDQDAFVRFCDHSEVTDRLESFGPALNNRIRRTLSQLAALGLIAKVTLPRQDSETGKLEYLKAFRPLRPDELTRLDDLESINRALDPQPREKHYFLSVLLDYETSERAGARGMFQVIAIEDEDANDLTHLVDQGTHYSSIEELKESIAAGLKVSSQQVELEEV